MVAFVPRPTHIVGTLGHVVYHDAATGYTVARVVDRDPPHPVYPVVGHLVGVREGERVQLAGEWVRHARHGWQFQIQQYRVLLPTTARGIEAYLASGLVRGVGPRTAQALVAAFGDRTLEVIDRDPDALLSVPGLGPHKVQLIQESWTEQRQAREVLVFLQGCGLSPALAARVYQEYGAAAPDVVRANPYRLARDVPGVGFATADGLARELGLAADAPRRIEAGVLYVLERQVQEGHVCQPRPDLAWAAAQILGVSPGQAEAAVDRLHQGGTVQVEPTLADPPTVYPAWCYRAEVDLARRLRALMQTPPRADVQALDWDRAWADLSQKLPIPLSPGQRDAVRAVLTHKVAVLTGGPGTGKTTSTRAILELAEGQGWRVRLAAPTGRAARRLAEATGRPAQTIHRLLEYSPPEGVFRRDEADPLDADLVLIDESSMLDLWLAQHLVRAVDPASHLLLVGDVDQLPSVGAGHVLHDVIASGQVAVARLTTLFRQDVRSLIVANAHRVNQGRLPAFRPDAGDFFLFQEADAAAGADLLVDVVCRRIPDRFGLDPGRDMQILAPTYQGPLGVHALNARLQEALNPPSPGKAEWRIGSRVYRVGDKVMQVRNDYERGVFNGDIGRVAAVDPEDQSLTVVFDDQPVAYDARALVHLVQAWVCTIHKAQGSEFTAVVIVVSAQHHGLLARNLLYTAITRAKELVVLLGTRQAIGQAVRRDRAGQRRTALAQRLQAAD